MNIISKNTISQIIAVGLILIMLSGCAKTDDITSDVSKYLQNNNAYLNMEDNRDYSTFKIFDSAIDDKEIFLIGEIHYTEANPEIYFKFLKYLKEKADVKYLLMEMSYSQSLYLNQYLESGDEAILERLFELFKGTPICTKQNYELYRKIYQFNISLNDDEKIQIIGPGMESVYNPMVIEYLHKLTLNKEVPPVIEQALSSLESTFEQTLSASEEIGLLNGMKYGYDMTDIADIPLKGWNDFSDSIEKNKDIYLKYFGDKSVIELGILCHSSIDSLLVWKDQYATTTESEWMKSREQIMYNNFCHLYENLPKGKMFGQFGLNHTYLNKRYDNIVGENCLASLINNSNSPAKNKVLSIGLCYKNCEFLGHENTQDDSVYNIPDIDEISKESQYTAFKLGFKTDLVFVKDVLSDDYHQYIITVRDSGAMSPYEFQ